ncbi:MAG: RNA polymerase sigma factor region1.1 domain-containing protein, partial [Myxococcota bacterium]
MASKASEKAADGNRRREDAQDGPLMDGMSAAVKRMVQKAKERGYVSYDELNQVLPPDQMSSEQIEDTMSMLSEMGITVIEGDEPDDTNEEGDGKRASGNLNDDDIGRTDDPVRMYLREMGSVELLSREGEIAIAKRIEAGRERMIGGICESPLTIKALLYWRESLIEGSILLRDIIDLDATYGGGPNAEDIADEESGAADKRAEEEQAQAKAGAKANGADKPATEKDAKADGDAPADAVAATGAAGTNGEADDDDDDDEVTISLATMEQTLLPIILATFDEIAASYKKLSRAQAKRLAAMQRGQKVTPQGERHYEKVKLNLIELMENVHFNNARIEQLVEQL